MTLAMKIPEITLDLIYSKISDYDIYRYMIGDFKIGEAVCNRYRKDRDPSFVVYVGQSGHLFHLDYGDDRFRGGIFDLVMQVYPGLTLDGALRKVASDFGITDAQSEEYKKITSQYVKPTIDMKKHALIQVSVKKWEKVELEYWNSYGITQEQLRAEDVYSVKTWCLNRKIQYIGPGELCFAYRFDSGFKIYYPTRTKESGGKWFSNICTSTIENLQALENADKVLIVKSRKDRLSLQNILPNYAIISVQNESTACFNEGFTGTLQGKDVIISYDADGPGVKSCKTICDKYGYRYVNTPRHLLKEGIKDWADWRKARGNDDEIIEFLNKKGLI